MNSMPTPEEIRDRIFDIITRQAKLAPGTVRADATLKDLGVASLEAIELIFDIEEAFDINLPEGNADFDNDSVQQLIDAVGATLAAKSGGAGSAA